MKKLLNEFKEFALKGNMLDMAIGLIMGSAFSGLVTQLSEERGAGTRNDKDLSVL